MVHNGIEYGDMQLICEAYHIMTSLGMKPDAIAQEFDKWNSEELNSFLIEITADILKYKDAKGHLLERIRDTAGQKGTGNGRLLATIRHTSDTNW
ncbi:6-phosphogluconate dehydrogenase, decarboxylating [Eumeta japonica]|uniref:phosphogluconate dehydrogenase (NADP(+)-dependent, decarboxylating) n=1 Tax=Eumeta variegata TaxID=151549 RepID=A0A4C1T0P4_EUMVA|nr:6-phosphogluconate dehydrogenase, decarboxylating [Eumeta japonica]